MIAINSKLIEEIGKTASKPQNHHRYECWKRLLSVPYFLIVVHHNNYLNYFE